MKQKANFITAGIHMLVQILLKGKPSYRLITVPHYCGPNISTTTQGIAALNNKL
ncbi:hypothetical protein [Foetidibacter luteolus]|uniref:hypothetical protein n=1 Tax=Foetidibacter luteolus TaxID=2608880 RepID=UPI00129B6E53|nr:hypothetical protein [Foetidibacter luteolus]